MMLCDTNILIEFYKANPSVIKTLQHIGSANIAVSVITKAELFYGARNKLKIFGVQGTKLKFMANSGCSYQHVGY